MNKGSRKENRYSTCILNPEKAFVEIDAGLRIRGDIVDLSAGGLAFEFSGQADEIRTVDSLRDYSVEIIIDSLRISAVVRKVWGLSRDLDAEAVYLTGVSFVTISSDDRLKLYGVIERIRDISLSGS